MKKTWIICLFLVLMTLPTLLPFLNSRFFYTQDYIFIARLQQMSAALSSGQFPVRWAPDLRYGEPLFNFYAPLPYYLGAGIHLLGFNFIWVAKLLFILAALLSVFTMYVLANRLFGRKAGIFVVVLYTYAPYRAVDMYVRGSLSETWAFVFFPLIFYCSLNLAEKLNLKNVSFLALSLGGLFLTHNVATLMFLPFLGLWWIYLILRERKWRLVVYLFLASVLGFGIAATFLLPAVFERNFIQTQYLIVGYFNFRAHFIALPQFLSLFWGYGSSVYGPNDGLSFQIGLVNLVGLAGVLIFGFIHRKNKKVFGLLTVLGIIFILSLFLQHNKSAFIWESLPLMAFIQFPWRFLGVTIFVVPLIAGAMVPYLKNRLSPVYFILIIAAILSSAIYFKPKEYANDNFFDKFLHTENMHKGEDLTKDYLPIWVQTTDSPRFDSPRAEKGEIKITNLKQKSTELNFSVNVITDSLIEVPIAYFPGWEVRVNNKLVKQSAPSRMGLIRFKLPKGTDSVSIGFKNTQVRTIGDLGSVISIAVVFGFLVYGKNKRDA